MAVRNPEALLNQTGRVLLGMIAEGHTTGYAIKAEIERSTQQYWGASVGGIYPELRRLREAGLVSVRDDPRGGATRHCYTVTAAGRQALTRWLTDPAQPEIELRHEGLLRLRFAGVLTEADQREIIGRIRQAHAHRLAQLKARLAAGEFDDPLHRLTLEFGAGWNEWTLGWCDEAERAVGGARSRRRDGARARSSAAR